MSPVCSSEKEEQGLPAGSLSPLEEPSLVSQVSKDTDQDGDPAPSSASARGDGTDSDTCSESGDVGILAVAWGLAALELGKPLATTEGDVTPAALAAVGMSSSPSSSEGQGSSEEASP